MQDITKPSIVLNKKTRNQNTRGVRHRQKASSETYLEGMFNCLYIPQNRGLCWVLLTWQCIFFFLSVKDEEKITLIT